MSVRTKERVVWVGGGSGMKRYWREEWVERYLTLGRSRSKRDPMQANVDTCLRAAQTLLFSCL